jgi:uncharacterized RDD family membrane protein YckC
MPASTAVSLAPWSRRVVAAMLDAVVVYGLSSLVLLAGGWHPLWRTAHHVTGADLAARVAVSVVFGVVYYAPLMTLTNGQTLGKMAARIRVVRTDGQPMTFRRAVWREAVVKIGLFGAVGLAPVVGAAVSLAADVSDSLWPLWDRENRALHDMLAGTRVHTAPRAASARIQA